MPITNHYFDDKKCLWFTVSTPEFNLIENITARELLSIDPERIELYGYHLHQNYSSTDLKDSSLNTKVVSPLSSLSIEPNTEAKVTKKKFYDIQLGIQTMIMDYFEVEHDEAALDIIELSIADNRKPPILILITMFDILLKPKEVTPSSYMKRLNVLDRTHTILLNCLDIFGSDFFLDIWNTFRLFHLFGYKTRKQKLLSHLINHHNDTNSEDDKTFNINDKYLLDHGFMTFDDFWDFVNKAFISKEPLQIKGFLYVLDIMVDVLERDFASKKESSSSARKSIFVLLLEKKMDGWSSFEKHLTILINVFDHRQFIDHFIDTERMTLAGKLLNMMIALSYYDELLSISSLCKEAHRLITKLGADDYQQCLRHISFNTFIIQLCDLEFMYADWSQVAEEYQKLKKSIYAVPRLRKWKNIITKIKPKSMSIYSIYQHVLLVHQYYQSLVLSSTIRIDQSVIYDSLDNNNSMAEFLLFDSKHILETWCNEVEKWLIVATDMEIDKGVDMKYHIEYLLDNFRICF